MSWDLFTAGLAPERARADARPSETYTVSAVNALGRRFLEDAFPAIWVKGEVTGWKRHPSGHCYFTLRDGAAQLRCVMFRAEAQRLPTDPPEGTGVRVFGGLTLYEKRGDLQLVVREMEGTRAGGLWRIAFERLVAKLDAEGLLAPARKRPLPRCPATIAVITSPVGAVLHDVLHVVERRAPWTRVVFCPARVQGEGAAQDLARALGLIGRAGLADLVIIGRGGGGAEDLWAFNEEVVARAIAACPVPVISAVGHEVDVTIADLVADVRAPTPSAAAELAVPDGAVMLRAVRDLAGRLEGGLERLLSRRRDGLVRLDQALARAARRQLEVRRDRLARAAAGLDALSPLATLRRGYAVPLDARGRVLRSTAELEPGLPFRLRVADGSVDCRVAGTPAQERGRKSDG